MPGLLPARTVLIAGGLLAIASGARAQAPAPSGKAAAAAAAPAPEANGQAEDRIFALVQAGKCGQAKAAAEQDNDPNLAEQIGLMCGAKSSGASSAQGGGRRGGGGRGGSGGGPHGGL